MNKYRKGVLALGLANGAAIADGGVTAFLTLAPPEYVSRIADIAVTSLRNAYWFPIALQALVLICVVPFMPWDSIKPPPVEDTEKAAIEEKPVIEEDKTTTKKRFRFGGKKASSA